MIIIEYLSQPLWQQLAMTLIHFLWQGLVLVLLIYSFVRLFRIKHGNGRYIVYLAGFLVMIASPAITFTAMNIPFEKISVTTTQISRESELKEPLYVESETASASLNLPKTEIFVPSKSNVIPVPLSQRISY